MSRAAILSGMFSSSEQLEAERLRELQRRLEMLERAAVLDVRRGPTYTDSALFTLTPDGTGHPAETTIIDNWDYAGAAGVQEGQTAYIMIDLSMSPNAAQPAPFKVYLGFYLDHSPTSTTDWPPTYGFFGGWNGATNYRTWGVAHPGKNPTTLPNTMGLGGGFFAIPIKAAGSPRITLRTWNAQLLVGGMVALSYTSYVADITARSFITG